MSYAILIQQYQLISKELYGQNALTQRMHHPGISCFAYAVQYESNIYHVSIDIYSGPNCVFVDIVDCLISNTL